MITAEQLRQRFAYDGETGVFTRRVNTGKRWRAGQVAGTINGQGYRQIKIDGVIYQEHRLAWLYVTGNWPSDEIDHIKGKKSDNRFAKIRDVSGSTNSQNLRAARGETATGLLGVTLVSREGAANPYRARIEVEGKAQSVGCFATPEAAHAAYVNAKRRQHVGCTI